MSQYAMHLYKCDATNDFAHGLMVYWNLHCYLTITIFVFVLYFFFDVDVGKKMVYCLMSLPNLFLTISWMQCLHWSIIWTLYISYILLVNIYFVTASFFFESNINLVISMWWCINWINFYAIVKIMWNSTDNILVQWLNSHPQT